LATPILLDARGAALDRAGPGGQRQQARAGGHHPVATLQLGLVERLVGGAQQLLRTASAAWSSWAASTSVAERRLSSSAERTWRSLARVTALQP
jgi:hypothetical protein